MNITDITNITNMVLGVLGLLVGVVGIAYAINQTRKTRELSKYVRAQTWHLYNNTGNVHGHIGLIKNLYAENHKNGYNLDVIAAIARTEAFSEDVIKDMVRQIQFVEPTFTKATIKEWLEEEKIQQGHINLFYQLIETGDNTAGIIEKRKDKKVGTTFISPLDEGTDNSTRSEVEHPK